jgi:photosystem II stability/assembly factor-like uncharacterized protein
MDPNNPRILYASSWQMSRNGYRMDSGGPDSKIFKSTDAGESWDEISKNKGLPEGPWGIVGLTVSPGEFKPGICHHRSREWGFIQK